uniref:Coronin n=1 Tax=Podarcis muralis TaxID=64176 RepID=A0A670JFL9_PODMU
MSGLRGPWRNSHSRTPPLPQKRNAWSQVPTDLCSRPLSLQVKVWRLLDSGQDLSSSPHIALGPEGRPVDVLLFHPTADSILASGAQKAVKVWDVGHRQTLADSGWESVFQARHLRNGRLLLPARLLMPFRPPSLQSVLAHANSKDSRLIWVDAEGCLLSIGFNQVREREVRLWDTRRFDNSLASITLDASPRALIPLFDPSTGLLVLSGKEPPLGTCHHSLFLSPFCPVNQCLTETKSQGVAQVPKLALDVMGCEVMRVLQLSEAGIVPISYVVPRKSTQEFHKDLFPDCAGNVPAASAQAWWSGDNSQVRALVSSGPCRAFWVSFLPPTSQVGPTTCAARREFGGRLEDPLSPPCCRRTKVILRFPPGRGERVSLPISCPPSPASLPPGPSSGFRHVQGAVLHRSTHITNLRGLNLTTPGECDGFCANRQRVAIPLLSAGGQVAVLELSNPGRLPDTSLPTIQNGTPISDLCWDPFDLQRLAIAGEDARIRLWRVEEGGLQKTILEPELVLQGHTEKIYSIQFHPLAADILASSSYDMSVRIWDLRSGGQVLRLEGHRDQIFSLAWSPDGRRLATVCKDGRVRVYEPRKASQPLQEGPGPEGGRGARIVWVCGGKYLLVSGFDSRSERQLSLHPAESLGPPVATVGLDVSPSTLIPFYDADTSVVFLTGKGDTRVYIYEVVPEGYQFLPKTECDVREVEIARALRLRQTSIEPVAFRVPRVKKEFFQDDLYPPTEVRWEPALSAAAWLGGSDGQHRKVSLRPKDMTPVSEAPKEAPSRKYVPSSVYLEEKSDEQKKEELLNAMVAKLGNRDDPLPQDAFEGVDEEEWVRAGQEPPRSAMPRGKRAVPVRLCPSWCLRAASAPSSAL